MPETKSQIVTGNIEIQHNIFNAKEEGLRKECVGIMLEIIKTCAAAGHSTAYIEDMLNRLEENSEKIFNALKK